MCLHQVDNPLLEVVKYADLRCMEEVGLRKIASNTGTMSKQVESLVNMARQELGIGCLGVGFTERSIYVVILLRMLLVKRHINSKFVLWTPAPKTDMPLMMI
jgi:hypothetical protein